MKKDDKTMRRIQLTIPGDARKHYFVKTAETDNYRAEVVWEEAGLLQTSRYIRRKESRKPDYEEN